MVAVIMIFSIPIIAIISDHFQKSAKDKRKLISDQLELEKIKHENFILETEKMKLELEKMKLDYTKEDQKLLP